MTSRTDKYAAKFSPDAVRTRFADVKTIAESRQSESTVAYEQLDSDIRNLLNTNEVGPYLRAPFLAAARMMKKVCLKYGLGVVAEAEVDAIIVKESTAPRNLSGTVLAAIKAYMGFSP